MNADEVKLVVRVWKILNRKFYVTEARLAKVIGKTPAIQAVKSVEDSFHVSVEKLEQGYHMDATSAKAPVAKTLKKAAAKKVAKKK